MRIRDILAGTVAGLVAAAVLGLLVFLLDVILFVFAMFTDAVVFTMPLATWCLLHKWIILLVSVVAGGIIRILSIWSDLEEFLLGGLWGLGAAIALGLVAALIDLLRYSIALMVYAWSARARYMPWYFSNFFVLLQIMFILGTIGGFCYAYYRMRRKQAAEKSGKCSGSDLQS